MSVLKRTLLLSNNNNTRRFVFKLIRRALSSSTSASTSPSLSTTTIDINSVYEPIDIQNTLIEERIFSKFDKFANKIALECGVTGRKYTYDELRWKVKNFNCGLRKLFNLNKNDVVGVLLPNIPEYPIVTLGIIQAGLICTTLNPIYTAEEIGRQLNDSNVKVLVTIPELYGNVKAALDILKKKLPIILVKTQQDQSLPDGTINFVEIINQKFDIENVENQRGYEDVCFMPYSSGTTGLPKGVHLTNNNLLSNLNQISTRELCIPMETSDQFQDIIPAVLPLFHIYGFLCIQLLSLQEGCKIVTLPRFTPDLYTNTLKKHKPTILYAVPPIIIYLTMHPDVKPEYLSSVRIAMSGAAPLGSEDEDRFLNKMKSSIKVLQGYGLTETSPVLCCTSKLTNTKTNGSVGSLTANTKARVVAIDDDTLTNLGPNETGELIVKGPQVMKEYHNKPEETAKSFKDGWFRTGDMVYYNEDKHFFVTDRIKELIKVKGFQVPPAELEELIRGFDNVADCAVIGIPHKFHGEVPRAYVIPKNGTKVNVEDLNRYVANKVAEYKRLDGGVAIVDNIPKNASGKILRRQIKLQYMEDNNN